MPGGVGGGRREVSPYPDPTDSSVGPERNLDLVPEGRLMVVWKEAERHGAVRARRTAPVMS